MPLNGEFELSDNNIRITAINEILKLRPFINPDINDSQYRLEVERIVGWCVLMHRLDIGERVGLGFYNRAC